MNVKGSVALMLTIGILAPQHSTAIIKLLKMIFARSNKKYMLLKSDGMLCEHINQLKNTDIDFIIADISGKISGVVFFDILICDNTAGELDRDNCFIEKNITPESIVIYNNDVDFVNFKCGADKIGYGLSVNADVTASSLDNHESGLEFVYCVQHDITTVYNKVIEMCEVMIRFCDVKVNIYHALAVVTCCAVCEAE